MVPRRRALRVSAGLVVGVVLLASCGDDDGNDGADDPAPTTSAATDDGCELVDAGDVEAAFGGSAEPAAVPDDSPPGTCIFDLESIDAGGDGQVAVVPLEPSDDEVGAFELNCQVEEATEVPGVGDRACYAATFQELYVLVGDRQVLVRAPIGNFFEDASREQLEESFLELGRTAVG